MWLPSAAGSLRSGAKRTTIAAETERESHSDEDRVCRHEFHFTNRDGGHTMDELVALVQEKAGLGKAQAKQAVETVMDFLKDKLPGPIAAQLDNVLENEAMMGQAGDLLDKGLAGLGGLLEKK